MTEAAGTETAGGYMELVPERLRPFLVAVKPPSGEHWFPARAGGEPVNTYRQAYDRGEVELTQGVTAERVWLLYAIPRRHPARREKDSLLGRPALDVFARAILVALEQAAETGRVCPSNAELASAAGTGVAEVQRSLGELQVYGLITVTTGGGSRVVTINRTGRRTGRASRKAAK